MVVYPAWYFEEMGGKELAEVGNNPIKYSQPRMHIACITCARIEKCRALQI